MRSLKRSMCAAILCLQAIVLGLTTPVLISVSEVPKGTALVLGLGLSVASIVVAGLLRAEWAYWLGWLIQIGSIALGFKVPAMFALGAIFLALWAAAYLMGRRIDHERAQAYAAYEAPH